MKKLIEVLVAVALLLLPISGFAQTNIVPWWATGMGYDVSSSSTTIVKTLVGQGFVGTLQGANSIIESGFLADTLLRFWNSISEGGGIPSEYALQQNYPNPFNPSTTIRYELPHSSRVSLTVYDILGRQVSVLVSDHRDAGIHEVQFDGSNLASGVYFYRLQAGDFVQTRKLLLVK